MRFNVEITNEKARNMKALMKLLGISTQKELFNTALSVFEWVVNERVEGNVVASIVDAEKGEYKELVVPSLETLWPRYNWADLAEALGVGLPSEERRKHFAKALQALSLLRGVNIEHFLIDETKRQDDEEKSTKAEVETQDVESTTVSSAV